MAAHFHQTAPFEEAKIVASIYETRTDLFENNQKLYLAAYKKGWLDEICQHMPPSRKKNKFVVGMLNPNTALARIFDYSTYSDFSLNNSSACMALRRFGVDTFELFENRDSADYLKMIIKKLANESLLNFT